MAKFRKKPVVIDAERYWQRGHIPEGVCEKSHGGIRGDAHIHTLEGALDVHDGDWVITGVKGEKYACKDEIFNLTYEEVKI